MKPLIELFAGVVLVACLGCLRTGGLLSKNEHPKNIVATARGSKILAFIFSP